MEEKTHVIRPEQSGIRVDLFLKDNEPEVSRTHIQNLILKGHVLVNAAAVKSHYKLKAGDDIRWQIPDAIVPRLSPENIPLEIVFEDKDVIVLNKPSGMVVHPGAGHEEHTLVHALLFYTRELSSLSPERPGIVHRLDKETSGLIVVAKNNSSHMELARQFKKHTIERRYIAFVAGHVAFDEGIVDVPLGRDALDRKKRAVSFADEAKPAETFYRVLKRFVATEGALKQNRTVRGKKKQSRVSPAGFRQDFTALELFPKTGRTHQLRVHLAYLGHPVLGDATYGRQKNFSRLALHAKDLGFAHPATGVFMKFESPLPPEMKAIVPGIKI